MLFPKFWNLESNMPRYTFRCCEKVEPGLWKKNCVVDIESSEIICSLEVLGWFSARAYYYYEDKLGERLQPYSLDVTDSYSCDDCNSFHQDAYFPGGDCLFGDNDLEELLNGIQYDRENPDEAPEYDRPCENNVSSFPYKRGRKETYCYEVAKLRFKSIQKVCNEHEEIATNCPGLCNKDECPCKNNPVSFSLDRNDDKWVSCDGLADMNDEKKRKKCSNKIIVRNCPGLCVEQCLEA
jgi:hypothetical protein